MQPLFGVNPETAHSRMAGLDYLWDVELCLEAGKLFHIHLNSQDTTRYDQDLPFGYIEPLKDLALCVVSRMRNGREFWHLMSRRRAPTGRRISRIFCIQARPTCSVCGPRRSRWTEENRRISCHATIHSLGRISGRMPLLRWSSK